MTAHEACPDRTLVDVICSPGGGNGAVAAPLAAASARLVLLAVNDLVSAMAPEVI